MPVAWRFLAAAYDVTPPDVLKMLRQWPRPVRRVVVSWKNVGDSDATGQIRQVM
jgi:hypothetical protein